MLLILFVSGVKSQQAINLPQYTHQRLHFGFIIAGNTASFYIKPAPNLQRFDSLRSIRSKPQTGFDLGIVAEFGITRYLKIRFVPSLGFTNRQLAYSFDAPDGAFTVDKTLQSVFLNFPVDLKLISKRLNNFEAYVIAGGKFANDLLLSKMLISN